MNASISQFAAFAVSITHIVLFAVVGFLILRLAQSVSGSTPMSRNRKIMWFGLYTTLGIATNILPFGISVYRMMEGLYVNASGIAEAIALNEPNVIQAGIQTMTMYQIASIPVLLVLLGILMSSVIKKDKDSKHHSQMA